MLGTAPRVIFAGCLIDGTGRPAVRNAAVVIADGRISYVGPADSPEVPSVPANQQLDARQGTVLPGLIDTHVHLTFNDRREARSETIIDQVQSDSEATLGVRAIQAAQAALAVGITTVADCGGRGFVTVRARDLIASRFIAGPRILASGMPVTTTAGHLWWCGLEADSRDDVVRATRTLIREKVDFIKVMATGGGMTAGTNILAPQYDADTLGAIVADAHRLGRRVTAHSHNTLGHRNCLAARIDMIEHCSWRTPKGHKFEPAVAEELAKQGIYVGMTIGAASRTGVSTRTPYDALPTGLQQQADTLRQMNEIGVLVVLSSDTIVPTKSFEDFPASLAVVSAHAGMTPEAAVHAATGRAANAVRLRRIGAVQPGHIADLLVVDGDVAADIGAIANARWVLRDGVVLAGRNRVFVTGTGLGSGW